MRTPQIRCTPASYPRLKMRRPREKFWQREPKQPRLSFSPQYFSACSWLLSTGPSSQPYGTPLQSCPPSSSAKLTRAQAIPVISDEFSSLDDVGWYGSAYLLTCCTFQLLFGKIYTVFPVRIVILASTLLFEIGSAICGAAPTSVAFIIGRAVCGVGSAGLFAGTIVCIVYIVPLHQRPKFQGMFGAIFGIASIVGPLIGGAFTSHVTWRWCFYINLPIGGVAMVIIALFLRVPDRETTKLPLGQKMIQLDLLGTSLITPGVVCLLLALQWGGPTYPVSYSSSSSFFFSLMVC